MTAELCDCYPTRAVGVRSVLEATLAASEGRPVAVWGVDGRFHGVDEVGDRPDLAAAANWLALAIRAARLIPPGPGLLIDVGSTTTDLIPLLDGRARPGGRTDTERLQTGELVYVGVRRTPLCAVARELPFRGRPTGLTAELFATTLDVYLTLGEIPPDPDDLSTADGRPATAGAARDRLARMVGADREGFDSGDADAFARAADEVVLARLEAAALGATWPGLGRPRHAVVAGSGEFLARRLAGRVLETGGSVVSLAQAWGPVASVAACAHALVELAGEWSEAGGSP
jgi:probable H4MPT-linked C1 transfer pathway protein